MAAGGAGSGSSSGSGAANASAGGDVNLNGGNLNAPGSANRQSSLTRGRNSIQNAVNRLVSGAAPP